jgi:hypothetical protein
MIARLAEFGLIVKCGKMLPVIKAPEYGDGTASPRMGREQGEIAS